MRKTLSLLILSVLLLVGCSYGNEKGIPKPITEFVSDAEVKTESFSFRGLLSTDVTSVDMKVSSPQNINGLHYAYNGEHLTVSYMGMSESYSADAFPEGNFLQRLFDILKALRQYTADIQAEKDKTGCFVYDCESGNVKVKCDGEGKILEVEDLKNGLKIVLYNDK